MGQGQKYDGSKFTGQSLASYKKEAQEHGASTLDPLQWVSKTEKLPKLSKMTNYSAFSARHIITPLRNRLSPNVEAISVNLESYKNLALKFNFPSNTFLNQVMGQGSELRWVAWAMGRT